MILVAGDMAPGMPWLPVCGQGWAGTAASFLATWVAMMAAMMLPALLPMLGRYRRAAGAAGGLRLARGTVLVGAGYLLVWAALGAAIYPAGAAFAEAALRLPALARAMPLIAAAVVLLAGALQFSAWKARHLAACRAAPAGRLVADAGTAWRHGLRLGLHCVRACAGWTLALLALGVMDPAAMALVTAAIAVERLAPASLHAARAMGLLALGAGLLLLARLAWPAG